MHEDSTYKKSIYIPSLKGKSKTLLSILVGTLMYQSAIADTQHQEENLPMLHMDTITVYANKQPPINVGDDLKTAKTISDNLIDSDKDLVRYNPDISVADAGRYGSNGYAIRGVDGNRVALNLDGVSLPDKQVNEIFSAYGYMFEGRFSPDVELLSEVEFEVGADSFNSGSGAMGGSVSFKTKDPEDLIRPDRQLGGYIKTGYSNSNEEFSNAFGLAGKNDKVEAIINYVHREGHETKNHRMLDFDKNKLDPAYDFINDPDYKYPSTGYRS
ncbi:TonB-dependent receptor plug domain-containing protein, partial [Psychrobacter sp. TWR1-1-1]